MWYGMSSHLGITLLTTSCTLHPDKQFHSRFPVARFSIPSLRNMICNYFVAADPRVVATVNFAPYGHGLYFCNATEVQKFSISAAFVKQGCISEPFTSSFWLCFRSTEHEHDIIWSTVRVGNDRI